MTMSWTSPPSCSTAAHDQVVGERPGRDDVLHPPVDARRLEDADHDREAPLAVHLAQDDDLLLVDLGDDDPLQLHLHGHGRASSG